MILYHGSYTEVRTPLVSMCRDALDFGKGFYLTSYSDQAANWARRRAARRGGPAILNTYEACGWESLRVLRFERNDRDWVEFVCQCRRGETPYLEYDVIVGGVADDKVYQAVDMYYRGLWSIDQTLEALSYYKRNDQFCFVSQSACDTCLTFLGSREVS